MAKKKRKLRKKLNREEKSEPQNTFSIPVKIKGLFIQFSGYSVIAGATNIPEERLRTITKENQWTEEEEEKINHLYYQVFDFG
jgi:hypothetical protein